MNSKSRHNSLPLRRVAGVEDLQGLPSELMSRAFPPGATPPHLAHPACRAFYHFTPEQECLSLPSDVVRTVLKLVAAYDGWEYVVHERPLRSGDPAAPDPHPDGPDGPPDTPLLVTVIEFESAAMVIGHLGIQVQLVAYPLVSVRKDFLDDVDFRLRSDPEGFRGILS